MLRKDYLEAARSLESLDFNLEDLFLWIKLTLAALSRAEKAAVRLLALGFFRASLTSLFKTFSRLVLRAVLVLSFLTFLRADFIMGIGHSSRSLVKYIMEAIFMQPPMLKFNSNGQKPAVSFIHQTKFYFIRSHSTDGYSGCLKSAGAYKG